MPRTIEYERGKLFYCSQWRYLSWQGFLGVGFALFVLMFGIVFLRGFAGQPLGGRLFAWGCIFLGVLGICVQSVYIVLNRRRIYEIRSDGICVNGVLAPWSDVSRFAAFGSPDSGPIQLFYRTRNWPLPRYLLSNKPVSRRRYEEIVAILQRKIGEVYPQLKLGGYENPD